MSPTDELELEIEPDVEIEPEVEPEIEPEPPAAEPAPAQPEPPAAQAQLMEVLPADFKLPLLIRFVPNPALRVAADKAAAYALGLTVTEAAGIERADLALTALRSSLKAIDACFEEPTTIANELHKRLTGMRGEWKAQAEAAVKLVGSRIYAEQKRLDDLALEQRRKDQAEADRKAREDARREAEEAARANAPAPVVEELKRQAETAVAPPVAVTAAAPAMRNNTTVTTWKARFIGTPGSDEPNPEIGAMTDAQRLQMLILLKAIIDGRAPMAAIEPNWSYLNSRAKADKGTLSIPGIEAFEQGSVRSKGVRGSR